MALSSKQNITRGGQIFNQNVGMTFQVINTVFFWSLISALAGFIMCFIFRIMILENGSSLFGQWISAEISSATDQISNAVSFDLTQTQVNSIDFIHYSINGISYKLPISQFLALPGMVYFTDTFYAGIVLAFIIGIGSACGLFWYFKSFGKELTKDKKIRGKSIIDAVKFSTVLAKEDRSAFEISYATPETKSKGYPVSMEQKFAMPKYFEVRHTFIHGSNGTGKSQLMNQMVLQIFNKKAKKIIFDRNGHAAETFYRKERGDKILNPFDRRSERWDLFTEFRDYTDYKVLANFMIPGSISGNDKIWVDAPRKVIVDSLMNLQDNKDQSLLELLYLLSFMDIKELHKELEGTSSGRSISQENERMANSIQGIISTYIDAFESCLYLDLEKDRPAFAIRDWLTSKDDASVLFITYPNQQAEALKPLLGLFFSLVIHWSLSLTSDPNRRIFVFCDELAAFGRLENLHAALAEGRKYGLSLFLATQNYFDIVKIYGQHEAKSILDQCNSKFFFRSKEPETCEFVSSCLFDQEVETVLQNRAYSNNEYRDGVSALTHKEKRQLVLPSEVSNMKDLECYLDTITDSLVHFDLFYKPWAKKALALDKVDTNINYQIMKDYVRTKRAPRIKNQDVDENGEILAKEGPQIIDTIVL